MSESNHEFWMANALRLARKGFYSTHPNPRVGCVIVRDHKLISEGFHAVPGQAHAEINALNALQGDASGATVYVTLEPCSHHGKTPPCADALIKSKASSVVIAMQDPNPLVAGGGIEILQQQGIPVISGILQAQAQDLNKGFIKRVTSNRPFVRVKMATTLDGRSALANGLSQWITGPEARRDVQFLRASSSAILSTVETVLADEASLNVRLSSEELQQDVPVRQPVRIILDSQLQLYGHEKLFSVAGEIWIFTTCNDPQKIQALESRQCRVFVVPGKGKKKIDLDALMEKLAQLEINEVHTECGATLAGALMQKNLVDELVVYMAPSLLGTQARGLLDLGEISIMSDKISLSLQDVRNIGNDIKITARPEV